MQSIDNSRVSIASFSLVVQDDMVQKYLVLGVAVLLYFMPVLNAQCEIPNVVPPSFGDVLRLNKSSGLDGLFMIYLGPDGAPYNASAWGTISVGKKHHYIGQTLCRQLGFKNGTSPGVKKHPPDCLSSIPVFLTDIMCEANENHILNCDYKFHLDRRNRDHDNDAYVNCSNSFTANPHKYAYKDQVVLFPPDDAYPNQSPSFGMVGIRQDEGSGSFVYISKTGPGVISLEVADTLCRSMGYTHAMPNSAMSVQEYQYLSNYTYENGHEQVTIPIDSSKLNCPRAFSCIRCCCCLEEFQSYQEVNLRYEDALVLRCLYSMYYNSTPKTPKGNQVLCESQSHSKICSAGSVHGAVIASAVLATSLGIVLIVLLLSLLYTVYKKYKKYKKYKNYKPLPGNTLPEGSEHSPHSSSTYST